MNLQHKNRTGRTVHILIINSIHFDTPQEENDNNINSNSNR